MQRFRQHQRRCWTRWLGSVGRSLMVLLAWAVIVLASPSVQEPVKPLETEDPRALLAQAQAWQVRGEPFPDTLLRQAVEAALQPEASWEEITAAITAFDVYKDRPWLTQVLQPFVAYHAAHIVLNAEVFARLHLAWTQRAIEVAAPQALGLVLGALKTFVALDPGWAKQLAATVATTAPAVVWPHVDALLAVDVHWAESLLREAALSLEAAAQLSSAAQSYFRTLVVRQLRDPDERHRAIGRALSEEVSRLVEEINSLFEQPAAIRFRAVETLTARELYLLLVYGEAEMFTSSYRGVFDRLLARMRQEGLTGDQPPATASAEGAQLNGRPSSRRCSTSGSGSSPNRRRR